MVTFISALELSLLTWLRFYLVNCYTCTQQLKFIYSSQKKTHYEQLQNIFINYNHTHIKFHQLHISSISAEEQPGSIKVLFKVRVLSTSLFNLFHSEGENVVENVINYVEQQHTHRQNNK